MTKPDSFPDLLRYCASLILMILPAVCPHQASAQGRMSDKDVEKVMDNLQEDAKRFRSSFDSAIGKSTIRKNGPGKTIQVAGRALSKTN